MHADPLAQHVRDAFHQFSGGKETIPSKHAISVARAVGCAPSKAEADAFASGRDMCSLQDTTRWVRELKAAEAALVGKEGTKYKAILSLFKSFDPQNTGFVSVRVLKNILMNAGEPLTQAEYDASVTPLVGDAEQINYRTFLQKLLSAA